MPWLLGCRIVQTGMKVGADHALDGEAISDSLPDIISDCDVEVEHAPCHQNVKQARTAAADIQENGTLTLLSEGK